MQRKAERDIWKCLEERKRRVVMIQFQEEKNSR